MIDPRLRRAATVVVGFAIAVSVVHYLDNTVNYGDYPVPDSGPVPSAAVVAVSWFAFTAFALLGLRFLHEGRARAAALCLAVYSGSGLVGLAHYLAPDATAMPWWRQTHIVADILCGFAVLTIAVLLARAGAPSARPTTTT